MECEQSYWYIIKWHFFQIFVWKIPLEAPLVAKKLSPINQICVTGQMVEAKIGVLAVKMAITSKVSIFDFSQCGTVQDQMCSIGEKTISRKNWKLKNFT